MRLLRYVPFLIGCCVLFLFSCETVVVEKMYDKNYILYYYKGCFYTVHAITIDTNFGKVYLKPFTPTTKIYSSRTEMSDPPYHSEYMGLQIGHHDWRSKYHSANDYLDQDFIMFGNHIANMDAITFYKNGVIKIYFIEQQLIINNEIYDRVEYITYNPGENSIDIGAEIRDGYFSIKIYDVEHK